MKLLIKRTASKPFTYEITDAQWDKLKQSCYRVWSYVASDALSEGPISNSEAMELCLDANRLLSNAHDKESDDLVGHICHLGGYSVLNRALCRELKFA